MERVPLECQILVRPCIPRMPAEGYLPAKGINMMDRPSEGAQPQPSTPPLTFPKWTKGYGIGILTARPYCSIWSPAIYPDSPDGLWPRQMGIPSPTPQLVLQESAGLLHSCQKWHTVHTSPTEVSPLNSYTGRKEQDLGGVATGPVTGPLSVVTWGPGLLPHILSFSWCL